MVWVGPAEEVEADGAGGGGSVGQTGQELEWLLVFQVGWLTSDDKGT